MELTEPAIEGWERRLASARQNGYFLVTIIPRFEPDEFSVEDRERLEWKLELVEELAVKLAWNMLKGTLKYKYDNYSVAKWLDMGIDDASDALLYQALARNELSSAHERDL